MHKPFGVARRAWKCAIWGFAPFFVHFRHEIVLLSRIQDVSVGAAGGAAVGRVALDIGIVCPQAAVRLASAQESLGAQPMIFESLGGYL